MSARLIVDSLLTSPEAHAHARQQLTQRLMERPASVPSTYLYDALGSRLFAAITELPEYYPTRAEASVLSRHHQQIAAWFADADTLVDLGAGDCKKAPLLLSLLQPTSYLAIDVSPDGLREGAEAIVRDFPEISVTAYVTDFFAGLSWPEGMQGRRPLFFYPGSSIGNFSPEQAQRFLRGLSQTEGQATDERLLLIGVDLIKPVPVLEAAYGDALGLTACFNLNLLRHVNRVIGADFDIRQFRHRAVFEAQHCRIEMSLVSQCAQTVRWSGGQRHFAEGERIITEHSYKYTISGVDELLYSSGFEPLQRWTDDRETYLLCAARALR